MVDPITDRHDKVVPVGNTGMLRCIVCKGVFSRLLDNGIVYLHVCPPLSDWEIQQLPPPKRPPPDTIVPRDNAVDERKLIPRKGDREWRSHLQHWRKPFISKE